ncbi:type II secretion system protein [Pseudoxanthomonas sp.]|uniref:type II secretion system protein n=1 Tax=Pseudoxanthomonas sp. TaxID=1871049 RepID=UPI0025847DCD|nr:type II secretion system protein [Pseudoxanthomonas sp.]MCR6685649.1 type II secretion system GspH family protein [Pseudoxanthomonas sp.]
MNHPSRQRGLTLIELAVTLAILGIAAIVLVRWMATRQSEDALQYRHDILSRADDALLAYASVHARLPCPASDEKGMEDCGGPAHGHLPWRTIGLPDAHAARVRYGVLQRPDSNARLDADLTQALDRAHPLRVIASVGMPSALGAINGLDFCHALRVGQRLPFSSDAVHTSSASAPGTATRNVAYALAAADPDDPVTLQNGAGPGFASPRRAPTAEYRDEVRAVGLDELWTRLRCGDSVAATTYSHFDIAAAAGIDQTTMADYEKQLEILQLLAESNKDSADAGVLAAAAGILSATAGITEVASEILKASANPELFAADLAGKPVEMGFAIAALATAVAAQVSAALFQTEAEKSLNQARGLYTRISDPVDGLPVRAAELALSLREEAEQADLRGTAP